MRVWIRKWGNSLAVRIPRAFAAETCLEDGSVAELMLEDGKLVIRPVPERPYRLETLLAEVTEENAHAEVDTGPSAGREAW